MARYGYARISTRSQRDDSQLDALRAAGCERNWTDTASGKLARRPEWDNCLDHLRRGDELAVTRLSRMARSVRHLAEIAETFGVSRKTVYRHLEPSAGRRQPGKSARPAAPAGPLATLPDPAHDRVGGGAIGCVRGRTGRLMLAHDALSW